MNPEPAAENPVSQSTVQMLRVAAEDAEAISALAGVIWHAHYADIISAAQIDYMLGQRYAPALLREQLARGVAWDKLLIDGRIIAFASAFKSVDGRQMKFGKPYGIPAHQPGG